MAGFNQVATLADALAGEGSRLKKRAAIAETIRKIASESLADAGLFALYLAGTPFPEADQRKLNAGGSLLTKTLLAVSGATDAALTAAYRRHGDLGAAALDLLGGKSPIDTTLTLSEVADAFAAMAIAKTTAIRASLVEGLLRRSTALEAKYLLKLMLGDMRIGVKQSLVEEAIAVAASSSATAVPVEAVRHAVMLEADLAFAVRRAFGGTLRDARMRLFHPLGFMLASPVETPEEAIERFTAKPPKTAPAKPAKKPRRKKGEAAAEPASSNSIDETEDPEQFPDATATDLLAAALPTEVDIDPPGATSPDQLGVHAFLEDKYDGMRAQIHCGDTNHPGRVAIYSRNREDITESFPELSEAFARVGETGVGALIFDGEILGWDFDQARALPFAVLGQRIGRKRVSDEIRRQIPVIFMAFDVMFANGDLQLHQPLTERRNLLERFAEEMVDVVCSSLEAPKQSDTLPNPSQTALFLDDAAGFQAQPDATGVQRLHLSPSRLVESAEDIDRAYADARARANEGVMLKAAGSAYLPGRRGLAWVKLKRELATLDVVITGAEFGNGRRAQFLSDYTFAVRGPAGELLNVGKAYSGVTDLEITELTDWFKAHTLEDFGHFRTVEPQIVIEVAFNNIMRSDRHASGFALRFPRIIRIRTDKPVTEIDTVKRVEEVYQSQVDKPAEAEDPK
ncbi:MAG: ATP-dependent DNA ligase [Solirubrobacteraceae bacterium]